MKQISEAIRRHLVEVPPTDEPVTGLTDELVLNLARHIVLCLPVYGRPHDAA